MASTKYSRVVLFSKDKKLAIRSQNYKIKLIYILEIQGIWMFQAANSIKYSHCVRFYGIFVGHKLLLFIMASLLAFAGSNSASSINFQLVRYTTSLIKGHEIEVLNMASETFPMYSEDREKQLGYPEALVKFQKKIEKADALILSVNEHNGGPSAYFKNLLDWLSRSNRNYLDKTKVFLMSTSPGQRGAIGAHEYVKYAFSRVGGEVTASYSLPSFNTNFEENSGIVNAALKKEHKSILDNFLLDL